MPIETFNYSDLGGGLNQTSPSVIETREMAALTNWYPYSTFLRRRGGYRRVGDLTFASSLAALKTADGQWVLIAANVAQFSRLEADGSWYALPAVTTTPPTLGSDLRPWTMFQYKNYLYALRPSSGQLLRIGSDAVSRAGISAPSAGPTIAEGAAGALGAGNYYGVYTYYNQETAMESNPSPTSGVLALGASKRINWTGISVSTNPFVNARRVYRTVVGQTGMYYFVFQINNNVDTVFTGEQVLPQDMGRSVSFNNGLPPSGLETGCIWKERLFASDGTNLYFSEFLQPEMFGSDVLPIFPDDGHVIRGLHAFGDRLIIGKTNAVHYLVGTDPSNFAVHTLSDRHGVRSQHSMKSAESNLFFYGTGKAIYRSDGTYVKDISTPRVADILATIPDEAEPYICAAVFPELNWYVLCLVGSPSTDPADYNAVTGTQTLVYNYKYDTWTVFTSDTPAPHWLTDWFTDNYGHVLYAASKTLTTAATSVVQHFNDPTYTVDATYVGAPIGDYATYPIRASLTTKADDFGYPGYRHFFEEVWLLMPQTVNATLRIEALRDGIAAADVDRTVSLNAAPIDGWRAFKVPTGRTPGTRTQLRLTYAGVPAIDLEQLSFRAGLMRRSPQQPR